MVKDLIVLHKNAIWFRLLSLMFGDCMGMYFSICLIIVFAYTCQMKTVCGLSQCLPRYCKYHELHVVSLYLHSYLLKYGKGVFSLNQNVLFFCLFPKVVLKGRVDMVNPSVLGYIEASIQSERTGAEPLQCATLLHVYAFV